MKIYIFASLQILQSRDQTDQTKYHKPMRMLKINKMVSTCQEYYTAYLSPLFLFSRTFHRRFPDRPLSLF